jgi:metal-responsive CopG/Arc/MetJ family transcriptional regulator
MSDESLGIAAIGFQHFEAAVARHGMNRSDAIRAMIREVLHRERECGQLR